MVVRVKTRGFKEWYKITPCSKCGHKFEVGERYVTRLGTGYSNRGVSNRCLGCYLDGKGEPIFK